MYTPNLRAGVMVFLNIDEDDIKLSLVGIG